MKAFDMFSGYGGFALACKENDIETVGFSEIDKFASMVLKYRFPEVKNYGDCTRIDWGGVPNFDLLNGGSPCQSFSIAGKRKGLSGASGLVWEYIKCLEEKKPRYFIWENVKGALSSRRGLDFANILAAFSEQGYDLWWQVLNAKDFGVPQNRERVFVVGVRGGSPREVFFEREGCGEPDEIQREAEGEQQGLCGFAEEVLPGDERSEMRRGGQGRPNIQQLNNPTHSGNMVYGKDGLSPALNTAQGGNRQTKLVIPALTPDRSIRRLTPTECERLMGLQDDWLKWGINDKGEKVEISDSQRYKMAGNGVVVPVVAALINALVSNFVVKGGER